MTVFQRFLLFRYLPPIALLTLLVAGASRHVAGQNAAPGLQILTRESRRTIPITLSGSQELVGLDDLATAFQLSVREDRDALTVSYKGRTIVLTPDQAIASVSGRVITLPTAPTKAGARWLVPIDFVMRALLPIYDARLELRRASHLLIVGDLRVPRVTMRVEPAGTGTRVTLDSAPRAVAAVTPDGAQRITVKFDADALELFAQGATTQGLVQGIRPVDVASLAIDLAPAYRSMRSAAQSIDTSGRLVIDLFSSQPEAAPAPSAPPPPPPAQEAAPPELPPASSLGNAIRTLTIDAGHGGDDAGAKGPGGTLEKDLTLAIGRRLKAAVESRIGLRVLMTRDDDRAIGVAERAAFANSNQADLFISLHANASFRPSVAGAAVYVARFEDNALPGGARTAPELLPVFGGGMRDVELVPWSLAQIRHRDRSLALAKLVSDQLGQHVPLAARAVDAAPLRVLESANMPAVLVEVGYLTNPEQETQLTSADAQTAIAQSIVDALLRFREGQTAGEGGR